MPIRMATTILASTAIAGLGVATFIHSAQANTATTWIQQVQRPSADAPCDIPEVEGEMAGWSEWRPSWEQWPHEGRGGWVCTRSITWAHVSTPGDLTTGDSGSGGSDSSASCIRGANDLYYDFAGNDWLPIGSAIYTDAACTTPLIDPGYDETKQVGVLAADAVAAQTLCDEHAGSGTDASLNGAPPADPRLYFCA